MKLKKCTAILMAIFLMFSNIGLALNVHFCGEQKISSTTVYSKIKSDPCDHKIAQHDHNHKCLIEKSCCSEKNDHSDCCKDEYLTQDNSEVIVISHYFAFDAIIPITEISKINFLDFSEKVKNTFSYYYYNSNAPPLYKLYCKLVLYA